MRLEVKFVEFIPEQIDELTLYISMNYHTATHRCVCGCKKKVVTPILPNGWTLIYNGKTVSLKPSIGSWNLDCQSHYFITNSEVKWVTHKNEKTRKKKLISSAWLWKSVKSLF